MMMQLLKYIPTIILSLLLLIMLQGCDRYDGNQVLNGLAETLNRPDLTVDEATGIHSRLAAISSDSLTEAEKHYRDFLIIKSADKAYIPHTSDSLFLTVRDFFEKQDDDTFTETLYYGGRVYSDMGVYPMALEYYQEAIKRLDGDDHHIALRRRLLSQTGRLLSKLGIYNEARSYVVKAIEINRCLDDTLNLIYNFELAGDIALRMENYPEAISNFNRATIISREHYPIEHDFNRFRLGHALFLKGDAPEGLQIMESIRNDDDSMRVNFTFPVLAQAYLETGRSDSALRYAKKMIALPNSQNRKFGYRILLSDSLRPRLPLDTVREYVEKLDCLLATAKEESMMETARLQHTMYNYSVHDHARNLAEKERDNLRFWLVVAVAVSALLGLAIAIIWIRKKKHTLDFLKTINRGIRDLANGEKTDSKNEGGIGSETEVSDNAAQSECGIVKAMESMTNREENELVKLRENLLSLCVLAEKGSYIDSLPKDFLNCDVYKRIKERIAESMPLKEDDILWEELWEEVSTYFPFFKDRLWLLSGGTLTVAEERTALMVRCGFRIKEMEVVFGRTKGTFVSRRDSISIKIFGEKKGSKIIDRFIRKL
ncbi:MAG: hypothetical protein K2J70_07270 [Muribaculaceae bacterium]|nr:hypothetical protein [Muribaculaceae bacterium]